jgi:hypothetical protein
MMQDRRKPWIQSSLADLGVLSLAEAGLLAQHQKRHVIVEAVSNEGAERHLGLGSHRFFWRKGLQEQSRHDPLDQVVVKLHIWGRTIEDLLEKDKNVLHNGRVRLGGRDGRVDERPEATDERVDVDLVGRAPRGVLPLSVLVHLQLLLLLLTAHLPTHRPLASLRLNLLTPLFDQDPQIVDRDEGQLPVLVVIRRLALLEVLFDDCGHLLQRGEILVAALAIVGLERESAWELIESHVLDFVAEGRARWVIRAIAKLALGLAAEGERV